MNKTTPSTFSLPLRPLWPWAVLLCGSLCTFAAWFQLRKVEQVRLQGLQNAQANAVVAQLEGRMKTLEEVLLGAAGYLGRGALPTRLEWHNHVEGLHVVRDYPGIQGLGFAEWIPQGRLPAHLERLRKEGFPGYAVIPGGPLAPAPEGCSSIIYLEPMDARNQQAFGRDMFAETGRRVAMVRARDQGLVSLSAPVRLFQEGNTDVQVGTLLYAPVYREHAPLNTVTERRSAFRGWVYIPFRMKDLLQATLSRDLGTLHCQLFDGKDTERASLLFGDAPSATSLGTCQGMAKSFEVAGRIWTMQLNANSGFYDAAGRKTRWEILAGGLIVSFLLFRWLAILQRAEGQARLLAELRGEALRATESRFQALFDKAPVGMAIVDSGTGRFLSVNPRLGQILGYTAADLLTRTFLEVTHPDHLEADWASVQALAAGTLSEYQKEKRYLHRDGHVVWGRLMVARLSSASGEAPSHLVVVEDISEVRETMAALRASEQHFRALFENNPAVKLIIDPWNGRIMEANPAAAAFYGWTRDELLGLSIQDLHAHSLDTFFGAMAQAQLEGRGSFASVHRLASGSQREVEVHASSIEWGERTLLVCIIQDVSSRVAAEAALRLCEARINRVGEQLTSGFIYQYALSPRQSPRFLSLSAGVEPVCGVRPEEVLADPKLLMGRIDPAMLSDYLKAEYESARDLTRFAMDLRCQRPNGAWRWLRIRSMPRVEGDGTVVWDGLATEVTGV